MASNALKHFATVLHPQAIRIFTPFTNPVPLASCKATSDLKRFLIAYEPKVESSGLFPHQADFLNAYAEVGNENFIITTAISVLPSTSISASRNQSMIFSDYMRNGMARW
ncbi:MAG: hypothetical protein V1899_06455 [Planctomycetota bacterium]